MKGQEINHFTQKRQFNPRKLFFRAKHGYLWITRLLYHYLMLPPLREYGFFDFWNFSGVLARLVLDSKLKKWHSWIFFQLDWYKNCNFASLRGNWPNKFTHTDNIIKEVRAKFQFIWRNFMSVSILWIAKSQFFFVAGNQTRI